MFFVWRVRAATIGVQRWPTSSTSGSARVEQVLIFVVMILMTILFFISLGGVAHGQSVTSGIGVAIINRFSALSLLLGLHLVAIFWFA
jgi:heme/copper-type cytochrome/quinol oxidase subunit 2